jgi:hypothetical protein
LGVGGDGEEMFWENTQMAAACSGKLASEGRKKAGAAASRRSSTGENEGRASSWSFPHGASRIYSVAFGGNFHFK